MEAVILAGGKGTRLQPLINDRPKPMALVAGRPFAEWLVLALRKEGIKRILFSTGYRSEFIHSYFGNGQKWGIRIEYSHETIPLGTAGALRLALPMIQSETFLCLNGDSFTPIRLSNFLAFHQSHSSRLSLRLVYQENVDRYGSVCLDEEDGILSFQEKSNGLEDGWINAGIYMIQRDVLIDIPENTVVSIERDIFPNQIGKGLFGYKGKGPFIDIGIPEAYEQATSFYSWEELLTISD